MTQLRRRALLTYGSAALATSVIAGSRAQATAHDVGQAIARSDTQVHYRTVTVEGLEIFYREAGSPEKDF